jgi:hypothetical protein
MFSFNSFAQLRQWFLDLESSGGASEVNILQCIARARATRCMYKLTLGPTDQLAARGNVCILPQDTASVLSAMPVPLFQLQDEICVILVGSPDTEVTHDMLKRSPLLVRRHITRTAPFWLIDNNPLYMDLDKNAIVENLEEYPVHDCPLAVTDFLRANSANNQGSSYTSYQLKQMPSYSRELIILN